MDESAHTAEQRIRAYYETLRNEAPLYPYFAEDPSVVKFGITERLSGYDEIEAGLREQTATTTNWRVDSHDLCVSARDRHAWFADDVTMAWADVDAGEEYAFDSRWSGTLERRERDDGDSVWVFVGMHVSAVPE